MDGPALFEANAFLWKENERLRHENQSLREQLSKTLPASRLVAKLQRKIDQLTRQNQALRQHLAQQTRKVKEPPQPPPFVKPNVRKRRKRPGRKAGHPPAFRPMPAHIDQHQQVPFPVDASGQPSCPDCHAQLQLLQQHERIVEDLVPTRVLSTCYHTASGWCPNCRKRVESRAVNQPPAAKRSQSQLGIHALATAAVLRIHYRLPLRQISSLFEQLPGLKISPGAIARQLQRLSRWLEGEYEQIKQHLRVAEVVHGDETGWRTNGRNGQLWTLSNEDCTLYHPDRSRAARVLIGLLGEDFGRNGSTLVSDFYSAYDQLDGPQQKCLAHLLKDLKEAVQRHPRLARHPFFTRSRRLLRAMLRLGAVRQQLPAEQYEHRVQLLEKRLETLGRGPWGNKDANRLAKRLAKYQQKLTTFLHNPKVSGTNNAAERSLRPMVILRKITGGSRSENGARATTHLASILRTIEQQHKPLLETFESMLEAAWAGRPSILSELLLPAVLADSS